MKAIKRSSIVLAPLLAVLFLSACGGSVSIGDETVSKSDVESKATDVISAEVGQTPKSIVCPDDLKAEEGESETCVLTAKDGTTYDMTATVKSVADDGTTDLNFQVGAKPTN